MQIIKRLGLLILLIWGISGFAAAQDESDTHTPVWTVHATQDTDLPAGVTGSIALLSPDGHHIAHMTPISLCVYDRNGVEENCFALDSQEIRPDAGSLRWSPDGRYLTFSENFFRLFVHSTVWLADTQTGELRPLIEPPDDRRIPISADEWPSIDLLPQWSPSGEGLYFLQLSRSGGVNDLTMLYRFDDVNDEPVKIGAPHDYPIGATYALTAFGEQVAINVHIPAPPEQQGVWLWTLSEDKPVNIYPTEDAAPVVGVEFSPDGSHLLLTDYRLGMMAVDDPSSSSFSILSVDGGEPQAIDTDRYVLSAGWSADGSALAYIVFGGADADDNGLYITNEPGLPGELILAGDFFAPTSPGLQSLVWSADNTLLISRRETFTALLVELEQQ